MNSTSALRQVREEPRQVAGRSTTGPAVCVTATPSSWAQDAGQRRLAEARRADEEHVVGRLVARSRRGQEDVQRLAHVRLAHEVVERERAERGLERRLVRMPLRVGEARGRIREGRYGQRGDVWGVGRAMAGVYTPAPSFARDVGCFAEAASARRTSSSRRSRPALIERLVHMLERRPRASSPSAVSASTASS